MLASSSHARAALCGQIARHAQSARLYYTSGNSGSSSSGVYGGYSAYSYSAPSHSASAAAFTPAGTAAVGCPPVASDVSPMECMNRNARKPSKANHGARPNSSYNRKSSSPEFGSWRHPGLRPGQTPPPRPQPGTPMTIATVGVAEKPQANGNNNKPTA